MDARLFSKLPDDRIEELKGKVLGDDSYDMLLTGPTFLTAPYPEGKGQKLTMKQRSEGMPLVAYLPGAVKHAMDEAYDVLTTIRMKTDNRGLASGSERVRGNGINRTRSKPIMSAVLGAMDPQGPQQYCRLTAFSARQVEQWESLRPLFQAIAKHFESHPKLTDRYGAQMREIARTPNDWIIPDTPFTTITVNNSYSTGVHTDKGDLDAGFSCLATCRRGEFTGARLVFPEYRVAVDMQDGDLVLMDAHQYHGNTLMTCKCGDVVNEGPCKVCGAERISVVAYFRTDMIKCGTFQQETEKLMAAREAGWVTKEEVEV